MEYGPTQGFSSFTCAFGEGYTMVALLPTGEGLKKGRNFAYILNGCSLSSHFLGSRGLYPGKREIYDDGKFREFPE